MGLGSTAGRGGRGDRGLRAAGLVPGRGVVLGKPLWFCDLGQRLESRRAKGLPETWRWPRADPEEAGEQGRGGLGRAAPPNGHQTALPKWPDHTTCQQLSLPASQDNRGQARGTWPGGHGPGQGLSCALTSFPLHSTFDSHRPGEPGLPHPWGTRRGPWLASVPILSRDGDGIPDPPRPVGETLGGGFRAPGESHPQPGAASSLLSPHRLRGGHLSPWPQA